MPAAIVLNLPSIGNTGYQDGVGISSSYSNGVANLITVVSTNSTGNLSTSLMEFGTYFGYSANIQNANGAFSDGYQWIESANALNVLHGGILYDTSSFNYSTLYLYQMLGGPRLTQQPNTGINTRIPYTP